MLFIFGSLYTIFWKKALPLIFRCWYQVCILDDMPITSKISKVEARLAKSVTPAFVYYSILRTVSSLLLHFVPHQQLYELRWGSRLITGQFVPTQSQQVWFPQISASRYDQMQRYLVSKTSLPIERWLHSKLHFWVTASPQRLKLEKVPTTLQNYH